MPSGSGIATRLRSAVVGFSTRQHPWRAASTSIPLNRVARAVVEVDITASPPSRSTRPMISRSTGARPLSPSRSASSTHRARSWCRRLSRTRPSGSPESMTTDPGGHGIRPASAARVTATTRRPSAHRDSVTTRSALVRPDRGGPTTSSRRPSRSGRHQQAPPWSPPTPSSTRPSRWPGSPDGGLGRRSTPALRTTAGRGVHRHASSSAGLGAASSATVAVSSGVARANCTSRLSCTRTARPGGGSRGASVARSPASAASSGSMLPSRKVRPATSPQRGCNRLRPPDTAPRTPTDRPSRRTRRSVRTSSSGSCAGWASTSWSQPSISTRVVGRRGVGTDERPGAGEPRRRSTSSRRCRTRAAQARWSSVRALVPRWGRASRSAIDPCVSMT